MKPEHEDYCRLLRDGQKKSATWTRMATEEATERNWATRTAPGPIPPRSRPRLQQASHTLVGLALSHISFHLSLNREGHWGAPQMISQPVFPIFSLFPIALWDLANIQACPDPDVVFPPLPLSALSSSPFHCALQDGFGQA